MNDQLDPHLSRLFAQYSPAIEAPEFLSRLQRSMDREHRHSRRLAAISWLAIALLIVMMTLVSVDPLVRLATATRHAIARFDFAAPVILSPLNVTLVTLLVALCLHRRIRAFLAPF